MRCAFPACDHDSSQNTSPRVTFHRITDEESLHAAWMEALGQTDWTPEPGSIVCSEHVLLRDLLGTSTEHPLQLCRICFTTDCKMYSMTSFKTLNMAYETVTGILTAEEEHLPRYLCGQCAGILMNCARFRRRSLRAHSMLLDIVRTHGQITIDSIKSELQNHDPLSSNPADNSNVHYEFDIEDLDDVNKWTDARVDESPEDVKFTVDQNHIYGEDGTIHLAIDEIKTENEGLNDIKESHLEDIFCHNIKENVDIVNLTVKMENSEVIDKDSHIEDSDDVNKQTHARVDESPEDVKFTVDQNHIYGEDGTIHLAIDEIKTENEGFNNEEESHVDNIVCDIIKENSVMLPYLTVKIENSEVIDKDSPGDEQTASRMASTGEDCLDDLTQLEGLGAKTMKKTRRVVNEVEVDEQQTPEADGPSADDMLRCDICHYQTDSDIQLREHLKAHAASYNVLRQTRNLQAHLLIPSNRKSYTCDDCKKVFRDKKILRNHVLIHLNLKPYTCDVCNKAFREKGNLKKHILIHLNEKPYPCGDCNKVFRQKGNLKKHQLIHSNLKPYTCDVCNKAFRQKNILQSHHLIHSNEKLYTCDVCKKVFRNKRNLKNHQFIHLNLKPYTCDVCNKAFREKGNLKKHKLIHLNEKLYSCGDCNKVFRHEGYLKRHLLIHSN